MLMYRTLDTTYAPISMLLMEGSQPMIMVRHAQVFFPLLRSKIWALAPR